MPTWTASEWQKLYKKNFGPDWMGDQSNSKHWEKIYKVSDEEIWETRQVLKQKLIEYIRAKYRESWLKGQGDPSRVLTILDKINPDALIIGFGRRFATYKRAHLLFTNLDRLSKIVNNPEHPVQFVFTGKAHPADGGGQGLIKRIVEISKMPEFQGKIIFLENYDMALAKRLISGVDIWLNTPTRPLEASGTSGQKAEMNGVLNFSVLDGWWLEGYVKGAGWALTDKKTYQNDEFQDQLDAVTIYSMLENEIVPLYFERKDKEKDFSTEWVMYLSLIHI
jgi:starch phosphorylase